MTDEFDMIQEPDPQDMHNVDRFSQSKNYTDEVPAKAGMSKKQIIILVSIGAAVLLSLIGLIIGLIIFSGRSDEDDRILDNVFAAGIELSGMTVEEATTALHSAIDQTLGKEPMVIRIYDKDALSLYPEDTNVSVDVEAIAQAAYSYGRSSNHAENQQIRKNASKRTYTIPLLPYLNLDYEAIRNTIETYCDGRDSEYAEPVVTMVGTRPVFNATQEPKHQVMKITLGTPLLRLDAEDLYNQVLDTYSMNELLLEYDAPDVLYPTEVNAQDLFEQYCISAQDAKLDTTTYTVTPETYGYGFNIEALQQKLNDASYGEEVEITLSFLIPEVLAQDINDSLYCVTLSEYKCTSNAHGTERNNNLLLSCNAINGTIIKPGETFSFAQVLDQVNKQSGYSEAPICSNNETVVGGGISQTASALYYCALHADLDIVEHHNHPYTSDFIELGMDAYVDGNSLDLQIRNNTDAPIRINASVNNQTVSISLDGSKELSYTVSIRSEITGKDLPVTTYQMLMPDNHQGYKDGDVMVTGVEGYRVSVHKEKIDNANGKTLSSKLISTIEYKKRDEIIARIGILSEAETPSDPADETVPIQ